MAEEMKKKPAIGLVLGAPEDDDDDAMMGGEDDEDKALESAGDAAREAWDSKDMPTFFRALKAGMSALDDDEDKDKSSPGLADVMGR